MYRSGACSRPPFSDAASTAMAFGAPVAQRFVPSSGSTAMSISEKRTMPRLLIPLALTRPTFSPIYSIGASSRSPSPMTMVPSIGPVSRTARLASTATWSDLWRSPFPIVCAHAMAACSTTRRNSSDRSESIKVSSLNPQVSSDLKVDSSGLRPVGRELTTRRPVRAITEQVVCLHQFVDFAGALVDDRALAVPVEAPHRIFIRIAVRTVNLDGIAGRALRRHGGEPFGQPRFTRIALALVLQPAGPQPEEPRRLIIRFHLRDHFL